VAEPSFRPGIEPIEVSPVVVLSQVFPARPSSIPDIRNFVRHCLAESPLTEEGTREVGETVFRALLDAAGPTGSINVAFRIFPEHVEVDVLHSDSQLPALDNSGRPGGAAGQGGLGGSGQGYAGQGAGGPGVGGPGLGGYGAGGQSWAGQGAGGLGAVGQGAAGQGAAGQGMAQGSDGRALAGSADSAAGDEAANAAALSPAGPVPLGGPGQPATFAEWMSSALRSQNMTQEAAARQLGVSVKTISRWVGGTTEPRMRDLRRIQEIFGTLPLS